MQKNKKVLVLDQRKLPDTEDWIVCNSPDDMIDCIKTLSVRGAPAIGCAAVMSLAQFAEKGSTPEQIVAEAKKLRDSRPTAVNLMWAIDRMIGDKTDLSAQRLACVAEEIVEEDRQMCEKMSKLGADLVKDGENILTHCNTGGLATCGVGTAFGVIREAHMQGKNIHVYVDETRPLLQGGRLTAWELGKLGIPYTLICDNMAASLMRDGKVQRVFVGTDRVALNGDFANKIGTYSVAVLAHYHKVPFHVVAPYSTVDFTCKTGKEIPIEERDGAEVRGVAGHFGKVRWAPEACTVFNPAFDVTPVELVESLVLDTGVYTREALQAGALSRHAANVA